MTTVPKTLFTAIERHGRETYPEECVGALIGTVAEDGTRTVERLIPIDNRSTTRERHYLVSPRDYLAVERAADAAGKTLLGFYHSHPEHPARPSPTDLELAQPNFVYLIVSIRRSGAEPPRAVASGAFLLAPERTGFTADQLVIPEIGLISIFDFDRM